MWHGKLVHQQGAPEVSKTKTKPNIHYHACILNHNVLPCAGNDASPGKGLPANIAALGRALGARSGGQAGARPPHPLPPDVTDPGPSGPEAQAHETPPSADCRGTLPLHSQQIGHARVAESWEIPDSREGRSSLVSPTATNVEVTSAPATAQEPTPATTPSPSPDRVSDPSKLRSPELRVLQEQPRQRRGSPTAEPTRRKPGLGSEQGSRPGGSGRQAAVAKPSSSGQTKRGESLGGGESPAAAAGRGAGAAAPGACKPGSNKRKSPDPGVSPAHSSFAEKGRGKALRRSGFAQEVSSPNRIWGADPYPAASAAMGGLWGGGALSPGVGRRGEGLRDAKRGWKRPHDRHTTGAILFRMIYQQICKCDVFEVEWYDKMVFYIVHCVQAYPGNETINKVMQR